MLLLVLRVVDLRFFTGLDDVVEDDESRRGGGGGGGVGTTIGVNDGIVVVAKENPCECG